MRSRAAAKGRKLLFLAAVCLLPALLLSPTAEASRGVSTAALNLEPPVPRLDAEAPPAPRHDLFHLEDELLVEILAGVEPEHHQALLEHRRLELLSSASWTSAIQKTASGVSTSDLRHNVQKPKPLKPDLQWTVPFYAKARFYDPEVGRFLTEDPAEPDLTTPPSLHKYLYAYGNPTRYWDPLGLSNDEVAYRWDAKDDIPAGVPYYTVEFQGTTTYYHADPDVWRDDDGNLPPSYGIMQKQAKGDPTLKEGGLLWKALSKTSAIERFSEVKGRIAKFQLVSESAAEARTRRTSVTDEDLSGRSTAGGNTRIGSVGQATVELVVAGAGFGLYTADNLAVLTGAGGLSKELIKTGIRRGSRYFVRTSKDEILEVVNIDGQLSMQTADGFAERSIRRQVEEGLDIKRLSTGAKGELGESAGRQLFQRAGYIEKSARLPGNRGFDGVFVKYDADGSILDIVINESKYSVRGRTSLPKTKTMGRQLHDEWVESNIEHLLNSGDEQLIETGRLLRQNRSAIRRKANVLDPAGTNRWNQVTNMPGG